MKRNEVNLPYVVLVDISVLFAFIEFVKIKFGCKCSSHSDSCNFLFLYSALHFVDSWFLFMFIELYFSGCWFLQGERIISVLVGIILIFMIHIFSIYWWCRNDDLLYPLIMLPPKEIPSFWHAIFIILVNGTYVS